MNKEKRIEIHNIAEGYGQGRTFVEDLLKKEKVSGTTVSETLLVFETIYQNILKQKKDDGEALTLQEEKKWGQTCIRIGFKGEMFEAGEFDHDDQSPEDKIMQAYDDRVDYSYSSGYNSIRITVRRSRGTAMIPCMSRMNLGNHYLEPAIQPARRKASSSIAAFESGNAEELAKTLADGLQAVMTNAITTLEIKEPDRVGAHYLHMIQQTNRMLEKKPELRQAVYERLSQEELTDLRAMTRLKDLIDDSVHARANEDYENRKGQMEEIHEMVSASFSNAGVPSEMSSVKARSLDPELALDMDTNSRVNGLFLAGAAARRLGVTTKAFLENPKNDAKNKTGKDFGMNK